MSSASGVAANKNTLSPSPATGIDSHFYWAMEKIVMLALITPGVSSYFSTLWKAAIVILDSKRGTSKISFISPFQYWIMAIFVHGVLLS